MKKTFRMRLLALCLVASMSVNLCACQTKKQTNKKDTKTQLTMVLDWTPNTNHTGLYVAEQKGYFTDEGLEVEIVLPTDDGATDMVVSGNAEFGIDAQDNLAEEFAGDQNINVTAVAAILQHNTAGLISSSDQGIDSPGKLQDHTLATNDTLFRQKVIQTLVEADGGDFGRVTLLSSYIDDVVSALRSDIQCAWINYEWGGIQCEQAGLVTTFLPFRQLDERFDYYSPVIIANNKFLTKHPDVARKFLKAVKKGYEYAIKKPEKAAEILCSSVPDLDERLIKGSQEYLKDCYIDDAAQFGVFDADRWNMFYQWVNEQHLYDQEIPENTGFTNEYIAE